jgi:DNA-binding MarR family transcriptional regulator
MSPRAAKRSTPAPRWLSAEEEAAWRAFSGATHKLRGALESQLERDSDLSYLEYHAMAMLSEPPDHTRRMSELAALTNASLSRLSHLVKRMEKRGFIRREPDPTDGRYTNAILTPKGHKKLVASAPAHVEAVRSLVVDPLTPSELRQLRDLSERILARIDDQAVTVSGHTESARQEETARERTAAR